MREPFREVSLCQDATHHVGFAETLRQEIFSRGLVCERTILVRQEKLPRLIGGEFSERLIVFTTRIIENEPKRKRGLIMLTDSYWVRKFR